MRGEDTDWGINSCQNTTKRSALRLQREAELLGGSFSSSLSRENIVLKAKFLRGDLPYFVEALGEILSKTKYFRKKSIRCS